MSAAVISILNGFCLPTSEFDRIPLFTWREKRDEVFYQGDVVSVGDIVSLEITSNCEGMDHLLKRLRESTYMEFSPIVDGDTLVE